MKDTFNVGDRVLTVYGAGTVLGVEIFGAEFHNKGKSFLHVEGPWVKKSGDNKVPRVAIRLDKGHTWSFNQTCYEWITNLTWID